MFEKLKNLFFRQTPAPTSNAETANPAKEPFPQMPNNPGQGIKLALKLQDANGNESEEEAVLADILQQKLSENGWQTENLDGGWLYQADTGYYLLPLILDVAVNEDGYIQTATTLQINHPELFPNGIFEFQYTFGRCDTLTEALLSGFDIWLKTDWETLSDAAHPHQAQHLHLALDDQDSGLKRLVLMGSVGFYPPVPETDTPSPPTTDQTGEAHDEFCECCLFTQSLSAFAPLIQSSDNYAIRIFVSRNADGLIEADCRVNGEDWQEATEALCNYAKTWTGEHTTFRKQYIIIRNQPDNWRSQSSSAA
ncbi:DUF6348 family protein [Conchiformibius steedae]|uniref:DUF6348 family protein n=1 Tax=Conchiformibius steedae TaxID=153493 RepID=UPI0026F307EE|nr:DUF6348 family protein [Conchiformibius steedae]